MSDSDKIQILKNDFGFVTKLCEPHLGFKMPLDTQAVGFAKGNAFLGAWLWSDFRADDSGKLHSCAFSQVILDKRMINRKTVSIFFDYPFSDIRVERLWALIDVNNNRAIKTAGQFGASFEGTLRSAMINGHDAQIYSLVKSDLASNRLYKWAKAEPQ